MNGEEESRCQGTTAGYHLVDIVVKRLKMVILEGKHNPAVGLRMDRAYTPERVQAAVCPVGDREAGPWVVDRTADRTADTMVHQGDVGSFGETVAID